MADGSTVEILCETIKRLAEQRQVEQPVSQTIVQPQDDRVKQLIEYVRCVGIPPEVVGMEIEGLHDVVFNPHKNPTHRQVCTFIKTVTDAPESIPPKQRPEMTAWS